MIPESKTGFASPGANDDFGASLAIGSGTMMVGAPGVGGTGTTWSFTGSGTSWTFQGFVTPSSIPSGSSYGQEVAIGSAAALVFGLPASTTPTAYVFSLQASGFFPATTITPPAVSGFSNFDTIAMDGSTALVGALTAAYVYAGSGSNWPLQATLQPSDYAPSTTNDLFFGSPVAISGDTALVGAQPLDTNGQSAHWAYVFVRSGTTWTQQAKLVPAGLADNSSPSFRFSIALNGNVAVLATGFGAYVFTRSGTTWTQTQLIAAQTGFGSAVAMSGGGMIVGGANTIGGAGAAYFYGLSSGTWIAGPTLSSSIGADGFGSAVAVNGTSVAVGAPLAVAGGLAQGPGAVYVYSCSP
jgi:hypothetical protein